VKEFLDEWRHSEAGLKLKISPFLGLRVIKVNIIFLMQTVPSKIISFKDIEFFES